MRAAIAALAAALALAAGALAAQDTPGNLTLTLPEAHALTQQAYAAGDLALAHALALRLLEADPEDARALLVIAATAPALGQPRTGRLAGKRAWAAAREAPLLRYEIARFTARAALDEGRPDAAQFWLRRAVDVAPDAASTARTARDFGDIRKGRRLSYQLDLSVTPSSNLNDGASGDALTVNGTLPLGGLSGSAQALDGLRAATSAQLAWRASEGPGHRLLLGARLYATANRLSRDAQAQAPDLSASDLNLLTAEGLAVLDLAAAPLPRPVQLTFGSGRTWYGGEALGDHLRAEVSYPLIEGPQGQVRLALGAERQWREDGEVDAGTLRIEAVQALRGGARAGFALALRDVQGDAVNTEYTGLSAEATISPAGAVGPARLRLSAGVGTRDYPFYALGLLGVTDGREDIYASVSLEASFPDLARFGYMPTLTLTAEETWSNISRFDTRTLGATFGFSSQF